MSRRENHAVLLTMLPGTEEHPDRPDQWGTRWWCRGRESNPYGLRRGIFVTLRLSPPAPAVRALDYAFTMAPRALGAPRLVSTPSPCRAWLGIASAVSRGVSPNLRRFTQALSPPGAQLSKSLVSTNFTTPAGESVFYRRA